MRHSAAWLGLLLCCGSLLASHAVLAAEKRWYKGNTHTHTLWSDGNDFPEMVVDWYRQRGYDFLALSDHNVFQTGSRWSEIKANKGGEAAFARYLSALGESWVETKVEDGKHLVRLKPFHEFRTLVENRNEFLLIPSE